MTLQKFDLNLKLLQPNKVSSTSRFRSNSCNKRCSSPPTFFPKNKTTIAGGGFMNSYEIGLSRPGSGFRAFHCLRLSFNKNGAASRRGASVLYVRPPLLAETNIISLLSALFSWVNMLFCGRPDVVLLTSVCLDSRGCSRHITLRGRGRRKELELFPRRLHHYHYSL